MTESSFGRWAPPLGGVAALVVAYVWCALALDFGRWPSLGAALVSCVLIWSALRLAAGGAPGAWRSRGRALALMLVAGSLMLVTALFVLLVPGFERGGLVGGVGLAGAAVYFGAVLFEVLYARRRKLEP